MRFVTGWTRRPPINRKPFVVSYFSAHMRSEKVFLNKFCRDLLVMVDQKLPDTPRHRMVNFARKVDGELSDSA